MDAVLDVENAMKFLLSLDVVLILVVMDAVLDGVVNEVFKDFEMLPVKHSKNKARRCTIMLRNKTTGKVAAQTLVMSEPLTDLYRADKITINHIVGFPVFHGDKGLFVGLPSAGWQEISNVTAIEYKPMAVSPEELIA
jgi:hypothetical protein